MDKHLTEQFIREHRTDDVRKLALSSHPQGIDMQYALTQISGWQAAKSKIPLWGHTDGIIYPKHLPMEQCTSQYIADFKESAIVTKLGKGLRIADLTGGFGVDLFTLSRTASSTCYNEISSELCVIARNNFKVLGRPEINVICGSAWFNSKNIVLKMLECICFRHYFLPKSLLKAFTSLLISSSSRVGS